MQLARSDGKEFDCGEWRTEVRNEERGESEIKRKNGFDTVSHVKRGIASGSVGGGTISPEDERSERRPFRDVVFARSLTGGDA